MEKSMNKIKKMFLEGMVSVADSAAEMASNSKLKIKEINLGTQKNNLLLELSKVVFAAWEKCEVLPEEVEKACIKIQNVNIELERISQERIELEEKQKQAKEERAKKEEAQKEEEQKEEETQEENTSEVDQEVVEEQVETETVETVETETSEIVENNEEKTNQ